MQQVMRGSDKLSSMIAWPARAKGDMPSEQQLRPIAAAKVRRPTTRTPEAQFAVRAVFATLSFKSAPPVFTQ
jgi:hypothetical protein